MYADLQITQRKLTSLQIPEIKKKRNHENLPCLPGSFFREYLIRAACDRTEENKNEEHKNHADTFKSTCMREIPAKSLHRRNSFQTLERCSKKSQQ
jgi:hypothetical protein